MIIGLVAYCLGAGIGASAKSTRRRKRRPRPPKRHNPSQRRTR